MVFSYDEIEALIDAQVKEHTNKLQSTLTKKSSQQQSDNGEEYLLTPKQVDNNRSEIYFPRPISYIIIFLWIV